MAGNVCLFDLLPVELLHTLFTYFLAHEILFSFSNLNDHVDAVLLSYPNYKLNFKSMLKYQYDMICRLIRPDQVISLTLSDNNDTPDQSKLFFSRFHIEQFTRLRSLTLLDIEFDSLEVIFGNLHKLHGLRSLSIYYFTVKRNDLQSSLNYIETTNQVTSLLSEIPPQVLLQLNRLNLGPGINFNESVSLPYLHHLTIAKSTFDYLQMTVSQMAHLRSLNVSLEKDASNIERFCPSSQLRSLTLRILDSPITMDQMERFLSNLPHLIHLELQAKGRTDLADGYRWQILSNNFITFNFRFNFELYKGERSILDSFCTSFWLQKKRWYVAYEDTCLFSVPHFAPTDGLHHYYSSTYSTIPDNTILYDHIANFTIIEPQCTNLHRFRHLKMLNVRCPISRELFSTIAGLNNLQHLSLPSLDNIELFILHLKALPRLCKLSIIGDLTPDFIEHIGDYQAEQIRTLEIRTITKHLSYSIEGLIRLFPRIECLHVSNIRLRKDMIRLIDGFHHLSNASFIIKSLFTKEDQSWFLKPKLAIRGARRLKNGTFTYRLHHSINDSSCTVHIWIGEQPRQPWWMMHWPPRRGYLWHRLIHILFRFLMLALSRLYGGTLIYLSL